MITAIQNSVAILQKFFDDYKITDNLNNYSDNLITRLANIINDPENMQYYAHFDNEEISTIVHYYGLCHQYITKNVKKSIKYYLISAKKGNIYSTYNLANIYRDINKSELAEKYYLMAINKEFIPAMNELAYMYQNQNKIELSEKYYLMAIAKGNILSLHNLAILYHDHKNLELAEKYYLMAIEKGLIDSFNCLSVIYARNILKLYHKLKDINNVVIKNEINKLEKTYEIFCFNNKKRFLSKKDICPICLNENIDVIPKECAHFYCHDCYIEFDECQICKGLDIKKS